ncbi:hypothetical protein BCR32DRAFT_277789 [Anaeromyces robustus]|uniref:CBM10 domain-containing protein n=1 Tax=Anaeromyces robustus TaxID=1754192 RepID=A0A1Y1XDF0_9FUNG|nr:hypothetical protein BCR32DRAFT_277789 [Anaeromyces robustus]|eukprot:ORX83712.1 hypothetical protein BCR32DRAFT_277789 [Anaeromyces robustus]
MQSKSFVFALFVLITIAFASAGKVCKTDIGAAWCYSSGKSYNCFWSEGGDSFQSNTCGKVKKMGKVKLNNAKCYRYCAPENTECVVTSRNVSGTYDYYAYFGNKVFFLTSNGWCKL